MDQDDYGQDEVIRIKQEQIIHVIGCRLDVGIIMGKIVDLNQIRSMLYDVFFTYYEKFNFD